MDGTAAILSHRAAGVNLVIRIGAQVCGIGRAKKGHHAGVLNGRETLRGNIVGAWLGHLLQIKIPPLSRSESIRWKTGTSKGFSPALAPEGGCRKQPAIDFPIHAVEAAAYFEGVGLSPRVAQKTAVGRREAGMHYGKLQGSPSLEYAVNLLEGLSVAGKIHEAHYRGREVELARAKGQFQGAGCGIADRVLLVRLHFGG